MDAVNRGELLKFRKSHAIIIGIDDYDRAIGKLSTPVLDATRFKDVLIKNQGFKEEDIRFLEDPTKAEIDALLASLTASGNAEEEEDEVFDITRKDCLVFYYAGHGVAGDLPEEGEEKGPAGYLLPKDAALQTAKLVDNSTLIKMETVFEALNRVNAHHTLLILDCCFAGAFRRVNQTRGQVGLAFRPMTETRFERYKQKRAWQVLASAGPAEKAADWISERGDSSSDRVGKGKIRARHSPFAMALFEALGGLGNVDVKPLGKSLGDGVITSSELFLFLHDRVEKITRADKGFKPQNPSLFPLGKDDGGQFIFVDPRHPKNDPDWAALKRSNPYKGLNQFDIIDSPFYYGREKDIEKVLTAIKWEEEENGPPILMITGASGSGKSSFVKAGILSRYWEKEIGSGDQKQKEYQLFQLRPGAKPWIIKEYEEEEWKDSYVLSEHLINLPQAISPSLIGADSPLDPTQKQILLIDQYEELFTACTATERTALEAALLELLRKAMEPEGQLKLFLTIRSDFEWQLELSALGQFYWPERNVYYHLCRLNSLGLDELRDVLINPAMVLAYDFEVEEQTNLVDIILDDLDYLPSALPLLSYTMQLLAEKTSKTKRVFLIDTYQKEIGGVAGAMQKRLQEIYDELSQPEQLLMKQLILRMVNLSDGEYTRRRLFRTPNVDELQFITDANGNALTNLIEKLVEAQLILTDEMGDTPFVELVHDSLINTGSTCKLWIQEFGKANLLLQRQLWGAVMEYHKDGEDTAFLWDKNPKISQLRAIVDSEINWLNVKELDFVEKSWQRRLDEIVRIKKQRDEARSSALAARGLLAFPENNTMGLNLAMHALEKARTKDALNTIFEITSERKSLFYKGFPAHSQAVTCAAFTPDGNQLATGSNDKTARLWTRKGALVRTFTGHRLKVLTLAISPGGRWLATGSHDRSIMIWNLKDQQAPPIIIAAAHSGPVMSIAFSPVPIIVGEEEIPSIKLLSGSTDNKAILWDLNGNLVQEYVDPEVFEIWSVAFSPDGQEILAGTGKKLALLWNLEGTVVRRFIEEGHAHVVTAIAMSKDEHKSYVITGGHDNQGGDDHKVILWNNQKLSAKKQQDLIGCNKPISGVAFSATGGRLAISCQNGTAYVGNIEDYEPIPLRDRGQAFWDVDFSPDGNTLLIAGDKGHFILHDLNGALVSSFPQHKFGFGISPVLFTPAGFSPVEFEIEEEGLFIGSKEGQGVLLNVNGENIQRIVQHDSTIRRAAFSTDGQFLVTGGMDGRVKRINFSNEPIWDMQAADPNNLIIEAVAISGDGQTIYSANQSTTIKIWNQASAATGTISVDSTITDIALSKDDKHLLIGTSSGKAYYRNLVEESEVELIGHDVLNGMEVTTVAINNQGDRLLTGGLDGKAILWDASGEKLKELVAPGGAVRCVRFSPDDQYILVTGEGGLANIWDKEGGRLQELIIDVGHIWSGDFSSDGKWVALKAIDESVLLFRNYMACWEQGEIARLTTEEEIDFGVTEPLLMINPA